MQFVEGFLLLNTVLAAWPTKILAPYCDLSTANPLDINILYNKTGIPYWTIGPIVADNSGKPAWGGNTAIAKKFYLDNIAKLRKSGGDVILFFGGSGTEIAKDATDAVELQKSYQSIIDVYSATYITISIQAASLDNNNKTIDVRNQALAGLQTANPDLKISYTLPTYISGLDYTGIQILESAKKFKVNLSSVNLVTDDFQEKGTVLDGENGMGKYAIQAANGTINQLKQLKFQGTGVGFAPTIGQNNIKTQIFQLKNAEEVVNYSLKNEQISVIAYNSINRDNNNKLTKDSVVSGVEQDLYGFATIFKKWAGIEKKTDVTPFVPPTQTNPSSPSPTSGGSAVRIDMIAFVMLLFSF
ncbi:hypothetical protein BC833DRAFT_598333 [Globomyces pollinis-pini]|nr:hypothetical protein BC833DRAFT_598333 [Globomyces pollinis-pini]